MPVHRAILLPNAFDVEPVTVIKLMTDIKAAGRAAPKKIGGCQEHRLAIHAAVVRELVLTTPDATLNELAKPQSDCRSNTRR